MAILAWINPFDSLFHVVTMMSSTGMDYINVGATPAPAKIAFIILGLIGGCTFSMAGGIRIERIQTLIDAIRKKDNKPDREELKAALINVIGLLLLLFVFSAVFSTIGISFLDSVFEISSALTTNGISMGITTVSIALSYKWLLILAMLIGRIEILVILTAIGGRSILSATKRFLNGLAKKKSGRPSYTISTP
jgi:trk system potassium uptake protein TrkH